MKKIALALILVAGVANAQLELNDPSVHEDATKKELKKSENINKGDDSGFFSFMNFSFKKDKEPAVDANAIKETPIERLQRLDSENNLDAQLQLAYAYLYGDESLNIKIDYAKSFEYYTKSANHNDPIALNNLANLYFGGLGTKADKFKAAELFGKAADLGNADSAVNLAFMYLTGNGIPQDHEQSIALFAKASKQDNMLANFMLGQFYYKGVILQQNYHKAFEYMKKASDSGYDEAQFILAEFYMNGYGVPQNYGIAVSLLGKSFAQGNLDAIYSLANILANGTKYPKDHFKAHVLYNLAAVRGNAEAENRRNLIEQGLKIEEILQAQTQANQYSEKPTEVTLYVRQTFGKNLQSHIK